MSTSFLSPEFLAQYEGKRPKNAGVLFDVIYSRTYSRWKPEDKRREVWGETVARVVEYSLSLYQGPTSFLSLKAEAESLFDDIFHLRVLPAGRTLWVGGTTSSEKFPESQMNCSFVVIEELEAFVDLFHLLLCGCGVGFRVLKDDVEKLPAFAKVNVNNEEYTTCYPKIKQESIPIRHGDIGWISDRHLGVTITVGDSREAWVQALRDLLKYSVKTSEYDEVTFDMNYDYVRPEGSRIHNFGGRAPGPAGLMEMFTNVAKVITASGGSLSPVNCMDICNYIGKNVIIGGTRRSSQIALGSPDDLDFLDAKKGLWANKENLQRTMSNNSIVFTSKPTRKTLENIFYNIKNNGEPGLYNLEEARRRRPNANGGNPCNEIILDSKGFCNLTTVNLMAFVDKGVFKLQEAMAAIRVATRIGLRQTCINITLPEWDKIQKRDRLLGVSMTGVMDAFDACNIDREKACWIKYNLNQAANDEADLYAFEMRVPRPLLVTAMKPEGTLSQLPTVSSGLHRSYAPYYTRRIRASSMDPIAKALIKLGVPNEPDQGKSERVVFSFPIKTAAKESSLNEPATVQLQRYIDFQKNYTDHNSSCTITIGEDEWEDIVDMVDREWDNILGCAFLPKYTDAYPQMPYEETTKEQYEDAMRTFPNLDRLSEFVNYYEQDELFEDELEVVECTAGGVCPVR